MKKLIYILFLVILSSCAQEIYHPFAGKTTNKPLKGRMTAHQVKDAKWGTSYYTRVNGKIYKNTHKIQQYNK